MPLHYGSKECRAWDAVSTSRCVGAKTGKLLSDAPTWCSSKWCYVDPHKCDMPFTYSVALKEFGLSYETCGHRDEHLMQNFVERLRGRTLRVGVPGDSTSQLAPNDYPWAFSDQVNHEQPSTTGEIVGVMPYVLKHIADKYNFTLEYHRTSQKALDFSRGSSDETNAWTACVYDTALGYLDVCAGGFWDTATRRVYANMGPPVFMSSFGMYAAVKPAPSFLDDMLRPLVPFSPLAWLLIMAVSMLTAAFATLLESGLCTKSGAQSDEACNGTVVFGHQVFFKLARLFAQATPNEDVTEGATRPSAQMLVLGYGLFVTVVTAMYTGVPRHTVLELPIMRSVLRN